LKERRAARLYVDFCGGSIRWFTCDVRMSFMFVAKQADEQRGYTTEAEGCEWEKRKRG
jgi:hypothetical protein